MNKIIIKGATLAIILLTLVFAVSAQKDPMRFGKIDIEDLKMTTYDKDTSAIAVVLCDYGVFNSERFQFSRHCRIKILKKEGTSYGNVRIRIPGAINTLKAKTYNLENGEIVESKMKGESVFKETIKGDATAVRFSLPNVKEGSIIEYTYLIEWIPYDWKFQSEIPVVWSELRMDQNEYVNIQKNFFGYEPLSIAETSRWVAKDMPAFRKEPYMNSINNYLTQFEFEVRNITIPGRVYKEFTTSWETVGEVLMDDEDFGDKISGNLFLNKYAESIKNKNISNYDKVKEAYDLIKNEVTWDLGDNLYANTSFLKVFNDKKGNSAEINLMLVSLLQKMDFKADPVVLSTRDNGSLSPIFPSLNKLNYVIVCVDIDGEQYFIDATDKHAPLGLLPKKCLNGEAKIIHEKTTKSLNMSTNVAYNKIHQANLNLSKEGSITGKIIYQMSDYAAYDFRKDLDEYTSHDEYIKEFQEDHNGLQIESYNLLNIDSIYLPVKAEYEVELENNVDIIGDNIYINPMLLEKMEDNPFKTENRKYPVDFIHPISQKYVLNLSIPEGYTIEQLPQSKKILLPDSKGSFIYQVAKNGNSIQLVVTYTIKSPLFLSDEYLILKGFYDAVINKQSEMIILKAIG